MSPERPITARQLRFLRQLAEWAEETFTPPQTTAEASAEIDRLKRRLTLKRLRRDADIPRGRI